jgi:ribonuclease-3
MLNEDIERIEQILGHQFSNHDLVRRAMTHASLVDSRLDSNERMEFLGDAVLGLVVCSHLFDRFPDLLEGEMTKIKSTVVSRRVCAEIASDLGLAMHLQMGKGMVKASALPGSVLAAVFESLIGALYLDAGIERTRELLLNMLSGRIEDAARSGHQSNFKSVLQQAAQQQFGQTPQYLLLDEKGPDHAKCFEVCVEIGARRFGSCWGPSKKQAEQEAALAALLELGLANRSGDEIVLSQTEVAIDSLTVPAGETEQPVS